MDFFPRPDGRQCKHYEYSNTSPFLMKRCKNRTNMKGDTFCIKCEVMMESKCQEREKNTKRREDMEELKLPCISIIMSYFIQRKTCVQKGKLEHLRCVLIALDYPDDVACIVRDYLFVIKKKKKKKKKKIQKQIECNCPGCDKDHPSHNLLTEKICQSS